MRVQQISRLVNSRYPGAQLNSHSLTDPRELSEPLELTFSADSQGVVQRVDDGARIPKPIGGDGLAKIFAAQPTRKHAISLGVPARYRFRFTYILPAGWELRNDPKDAAEGSPFGRYKVRWLKEIGAVRGDLLFELHKDQIEASDYPAFYEYMPRFDAAIRPDLQLRVSGGAGS
jgi:hypothetical protein